MKKMALALVLASTACESQRGGVQCIGVTDVPEQSVKYEYSKRNIALGLIFIEAIWPTVDVVFWNLRCPVRK